jgi:hypothetical protein
MGSITIGIDLASQAADTAICAIDWELGAPVIKMLAVSAHEGTELHDKFLVTTIAGLRHFPAESIAKAGIDSPFGWPEDFVKAVAEHHWNGHWPGGIDNPRTPFYRRETDRHVRSVTGKVPLSVSSDKIAAVAMRCAVLLDYLREKCGPASVDRTGTGLVCEVYPDPALRHWTAADPLSLQPRESYKRKAGASRRRDLLGIVRQRIRLEDPNDLLGACVEHDHALDALVAALVARAVSLGLTDSLGLEDDQISREGWIHLPTSPLADLASSTTSGESCPDETT